MTKTPRLNLDDVEQWNTEDASELERPAIAKYNVAIAARDWTVETIVQQVKQGNIDLDPAFQRRNAWRDNRRSRLIESFLLGFPVPQIVLAENPRRRRTFIVIDGKQRLLTVSGLYLAEYRDYWTKSRLSGMNVLKALNGVELDALMNAPQYEAERRQLANADIRTTVITGFNDEGVLYDIFYRINTGSVPLSSQELRQVLNRGEFAKHLIEVTSNPNPLWRVLEIEEPDPRLRDIELLLRLIAWKRFSQHYTGNMKPFLDQAMSVLNESWVQEQDSIKELITEILAGMDVARDVFGEHVGRKFKNGSFESALNRALFEVQAYYFSFADIRKNAVKRKTRVVGAFKGLSNDPDFNQSIEATTKSIENYRVRFNGYRAMLEDALGVTTQPLLLGQKNSAQ